MKKQQHTDIPYKYSDTDAAGCPCAPAHAAINNTIFSAIPSGIGLSNAVKRMFHPRTPRKRAPRRHEPGRPGVTNTSVYMTTMAEENAPC